MGLTEPGPVRCHRPFYPGGQTRRSLPLNGSKMFITNGPIADVAVVYARTASAGERHEGISAFIIDKGTKGFSAGTS